VGSKGWARVDCTPCTPYCYATGEKCPTRICSPDTKR